MTRLADALAKQMGGGLPDVEAEYATSAARLETLDDELAELAEILLGRLGAEVAGAEVVRWEGAWWWRVPTGGWVVCSPERGGRSADG